jgi:8-oxo-dGTP pyrophosphatase MutT (NUDIX family)
MRGAHDARNSPVLKKEEQVRRRMIKSDNIPESEIEKNCNCAGIFLVKDSPDGLQVLLVESRRKQFQFSFPKGKRNKKEGTLEAAKRELREETGCIEDDYELVPGKLFIEYREDTKTPHIVYYLARLTNKDVVLCPQDTKEIKSCAWYSPSEIYNMRRTFYLQRRQIVTRAIRDYIGHFCKSDYLPLRNNQLGESRAHQN